MENRRFVLFETLRYLWRTLLRRKKDPFASLDEPFVDQPNDAAQRRAFVRAGCTFPVEAQAGGRNEHCVVLSISGSGLLLLDKRILNAGDTLVVSGRIYDRPMRIAARIAREDKAFAGFDGLHAYGAHITSIAETDRRHIVRSIFRSYRHLRDIDQGGLDE